MHLMILISDWPSPRIIEHVIFNCDPEANSFFLNFNFRLSSDDEGVARKARAASSSRSRSHSEFSSQSESESSTKRVELAENEETTSRRRFIRHCTLSDSTDWIDPYPKYSYRFVSTVFSPLFGQFFVEFQKGCRRPIVTCRAFYFWHSP